MLEVNYCNLVAVGAVAAEDGLQARRGPALVIYEAACPEIPTSHHTTLILLPHSQQSSNSSNPSNNCVNAPTFVLLDIYVDIHIDKVEPITWRKYACVHV